MLILIGMKDYRFICSIFVPSVDYKERKTQHSFYLYFMSLFMLVEVLSLSIKIRDNLQTN